jgi:plastocyanin
MKGRVMAAVAAGGVAALALTGCGSSSGGGAYVQPKGAPVKTVTVVADHLSFAPEKIATPPGILEVKLKAVDIVHSFVIEGIPGFMVESSSGETNSGKVELKQGKYTFYCNVPGHRAAGMQGTITVG